MEEVDIHRALQTKIVYQTDENGRLAGEVPAYESPLEPGVFALPRGAVEHPPPSYDPETQQVRWGDQGWIVEPVLRAYVDGDSGAFLGLIGQAPRPEVANLLEVTPLPETPFDLWDAATGTWTPGTPPAPVTVSFRQFLLGLMADGKLSGADAEMWSKRTSLPASVIAFVDTLPAAERVAMRVTLRTMTEVDRTLPEIAAAGQMFGYETPEAIEDAFRRWSEL